MNIYKITNTTNNKSYIGKTSKDIQSRFTEHKKNAYKKINRHLYDAMNCYGFDSFIIELIEIVDDNIANDRERHWIRTLDTKSPVGYNMTDGGDGGYTLKNWSIEERKQLYTKQGDSRRGKRSDKFCETMSNVAYIREANKTEDQKREIADKISKTLKSKGIVPPLHITYGADNPNYVHVDIDICLEMIANGFTQKEIALHFGTTSTTIWAKLKEHTGKSYNELRRIDSKSQ